MYILLLSFSKYISSGRERERETKGERERDKNIDFLDVGMKNFHFSFFMINSFCKDNKRHNKRNGKSCLLAATMHA